VDVEIDPRALVDAIMSDQQALTELAAALRALDSAIAAASPLMSIPEAADHLRCRRQRIDDLLSARRLTRYKDGRRTLVLRAEVEALPILESAARDGDTLVTPPLRCP